MNMFGFIQFNKEVIAAGIAERTGKTVKLGRLNWHADSYHIYGKDIQAAKERLFDRTNDMAFETIAIPDFATGALNLHTP